MSTKRRPVDPSETKKIAFPDDLDRWFSQGFLPVVTTSKRNTGLSEQGAGLRQATFVESHDEDDGYCLFTTTQKQSRSAKSAEFIQSLDYDNGYCVFSTKQKLSGPVIPSGHFTASRSCIERENNQAHSLLSLKGNKPCSDKPSISSVMHTKKAVEDINAGDGYNKPGCESCLKKESSNSKIREVKIKKRVSFTEPEDMHMQNINMEKASFNFSDMNHYSTCTSTGSMVNGNVTSKFADIVSEDGPKQEKSNDYDFQANFDDDLSDPPFPLSQKYCGDKPSCEEDQNVPEMNKEELPLAEDVNDVWTPLDGTVIPILELIDSSDTEVKQSKRHSFQLH